tara:strand:+ start:24493 stop:25260 length:768 start_codon:yes stop_codon:yes gene_type:complete
MINSDFRTRLKSGAPLLGVFVSIESPTTVELLAAAGVDYVMIDGEHNPISATDAVEMIRAAEAKGLPAMSRVGENSQQVIAKYLDAGSLGVMIPMVNSAKDAQSVVDSVKYPPLGKRGLAGVRANDYATNVGYVDVANESTVVMVQIETNDGIKNADEIISTEGVDAVFLGPSDLSVALGVAGQAKHESVLNIIEELTKKIVAAGKTAGTIARTPEDYAYWRDRGVQLFLTGANGLLLGAAKDYIESSRALEEGR